MTGRRTNPGTTRGRRHVVAGTARRSVPRDQPVGESTAEEPIAPSEPVGALAPAEPAPAAPRRVAKESARSRATVLGMLSGVVVIVTCLAVWFVMAAHRLSNGTATANAALVDVGTTNAVLDQIGRAVVTAFSYDYATIDRTEAAARDVLTAAAAEQYQASLDRTRQQALAERTVLTTAVRSIGVMNLSGVDGATPSEARLLVFVDRQIVRHDNQHESAAGQLIVGAQRFGHTWKITDIQVV